ncbi:MAG: CDP-diacylglycerol--glycerol-3-phosphate 3-phosphatidyltransferase [Pseudomonadota bacterium]|nr:MAG: CDP-diacylglycerol--glycerol-3-phosphate 3-phosphatidyltransferase [Pseudomonadota bacterium]
MSSSSPEIRSQRRQSLKEELLNIPNLITYLRILVIPVFLWLVWRGDPHSSVLAASLFALAAISDVLDGWLARRLGCVSVVGKLLDPLADKLIVTASLVMLAQMGRIEAWLVIVILSRELIVSGLRQIASSEGLVIAASQGGKWKTALQLTGIVAVLVHYPYTVDFLVVEPIAFRFQVVGEWLLLLSLVPSVLSAIQYFAGFLAAVARKEEAGAGP